MPKTKAFKISRHLRILSCCKCNFFEIFISLCHHVCYTYLHRLRKKPDHIQPQEYMNVLNVSQLMLSFSSLLHFHVAWFKHVWDLFSWNIVLLHVFSTAIYLYFVPPLDKKKYLPSGVISSKWVWKSFFSKIIIYLFKKHPNEQNLGCFPTIFLKRNTKSLSRPWFSYFNFWLRMAAEGNTTIFSWSYAVMFTGLISQKQTDHVQNERKHGHAPS